MSFGGSMVIRKETAKWWLLVYKFPKLTASQADAYRPMMDRKELIGRILASAQSRARSVAPTRLAWGVSDLQTMKMTGVTHYAFTLHRPVSGDYKVLNDGGAMTDRDNRARRTTQVVVDAHATHHIIAVKHSSYLGMSAKTFARALESIFREELESIHQDEYYLAEVSMLPEHRSFVQWWEEVEQPLDFLRVRFSGANLPARQPLGAFLTASMEGTRQELNGKVVEVKTTEVQLTADQAGELDDAVSTGRFHLDAKAVHRESQQILPWSSSAEGMTERATYAMVDQSKRDFLKQVFRMFGGQADDGPDT